MLQSFKTLMDTIASEGEEARSRLGSYYRGGDADFDSAGKP